MSTKGLRIGQDERAGSASWEARSRLVRFADGSWVTVNRRRLRVVEG